MGKNDFLTPKAIANRIKSKGLQKLRWYCQMCGKQCRDENGFKCHLTSDGHRRQMELFGQNPDRIIEGYSEEFLKSFLEHMRVAHPTVRIEAHKVYNEYIQDKHHIHMNSTQWHTLTEFVKFLGRQGYCKVEDTPKGWFIALIKRDTDEELADAAKRKRQRKEMEEELRLQKEIQAQVERAKELEQETDALGDSGDPAPRLLERPADAGPIKLALATDRMQSSRPAAAAGASEERRKPVGMFDDGKSGADPTGGGSAYKKSKVAEIMEREQARKAAAAAAAAAADAGPLSDSWLYEGIVVKVMARELHDYYKQKGAVLRVIDRFVGEIEMLESGDLLRVDQSQLETVIPKVGGRVMVVNGRHQGEDGEVEDILKDDFKVKVRLKSGRATLEEYEHVSKLAQ